MRAIVIKQYGGPEQLVLRDLPEPEPMPGHVVIEVAAFGLNHAEIYFRQGVWGDVAKVSGIECVGRVKADPDGRLAPGQTVTALMGGMGRTINGSYAEVTRVPAANVVPLDTTMPWEELAALPESYATAWTCLTRNLALAHGQTVLIRGATSALGQAAVNIASLAGAHVIATTRNAVRFATLQALGVETTLLEVPALAAQIRARHPRGIDAALDLVGTTTLLDSLAAVRPDGRVCMAGFLGGAAPLAAFDPLMHMPSGVHLSFFASAFTFGNDDYRLVDIPLQAIVDRAASGAYRARPARVFRFDEIQDAHRLMESGDANGKIVVRL
ncbi:MAG TPA: zinc-binding dehydrogenase [Xanthobacteraceae bacterium]|nr:zinc-binding dehydrogenase [Xanthobacteraceae bacterium]